MKVFVKGWQEKQLLLLPFLAQSHSAAVVRHPIGPHRKGGSDKTGQTPGRIYSPWKRRSSKGTKIRLQMCMCVHFWGGALVRV